MTARLMDGPNKWSGSRDQQGYRTYKVTYRVATDDPRDGPAIVMQTPGLPAPGSTWSIDNDVDDWAFCKLEMTVTPDKTDEPNCWWTVELTFTTSPDGKLCKVVQIDDPLMEPQKVSGHFIRAQEEATEDRFGNRILTSSHEMIRGKQVEFDASRPQVTIEQNVADLQYEMASSMVDTLNDDILWSFPARCVKLSEFHWDKKFYGQCSSYYTRKFTFDVNIKYNTALGIYESGWDRSVLDEGSKVLHGRWDKTTGRWVLININGLPPDPANPKHFDRFKDRNNENTRVILDGHGLPADVDIGTGTGSLRRSAGSVRVEKYEESNMLLLNIPTSF